MERGQGFRLRHGLALLHAGAGVVHDALPALRANAASIAEEATARVQGRVVGK